MLETLSPVFYSLVRGIGIYLAVTLAISSPVICYYCAKGAFTAPTDHWEPARKHKAA